MMTPDRLKAVCELLKDNPRRFATTAVDAMTRAAEAIETLTSQNTILMKNFQDLKSKQSIEQSVRVPFKSKNQDKAES